mgnify:CR=1 FL=1
MNQSDTSQPIIYTSLAALRAAHHDLLALHRPYGSTPELLSQARLFTEQGQGIGVLLDNNDERELAQSLLDYWSAILYRAGVEPPDAALAEFDWNLAPELPDEQCPYVGLDAFSEVKQDLFFGRERLVESALTRLQRQRLLAVVGPSGSGKSSLVLAGLLPALKSGAVRGSAKWRYLPRMVPGSDPLHNLARTLASLLPEGQGDDAWISQQAEAMAQNPAHIGSLLQQETHTPVLLVVDQFEEVFTLCFDDTGRRAFVACLLALFQAPELRHTLILTMRTDFESQVARLPGFQPYFEQHSIRITPLNAAELRSAIEAPAARIGLKFEQGLVDTLLQDILGEPAALPLLQFTLLKLWEHREHNYITWDAYRALGGGRLALANSADAFYNNLIPEQQITARRILLRLVRTGDGLEITSNRVRRDTLFRSGEAGERVSRVLQKLIDARLVRVTEGDVPGDTQVEIAHEALVRNWPRLVDWLDEERERIRQRQRLADAAEQWVMLKRNDGALLTATLLDEATRFISETGDELTNLELEFLQASQHALATAQEQEIHRQAELRRAQIEAQNQARWVRRLGWITLVLFSLLALPVLVLTLNLRQRQSAWQPLENFPRDTVSSLAATWTQQPDAAPELMICAGTSNIGVGCTQQGRTWNIYQQDLPTGEAETGGDSEFPGTVRGVQTMSIDALNPRRISMILWDGKMYRSDSSGVRWRQVGENLPSTQAYAQRLATIGNVALAVINNQLYGSIDSGTTWQLFADVNIYGWNIVYDVYASAPDQAVYIATDTGIYSNPAGNAWNWQQLVDTAQVYNVTRSPGSDLELLFIAAGATQRNVLYRWQPGQSPREVAFFVNDIISLIPGVQPEGNTLAFVLKESGEVIAIDQQGNKRSLGRRPGWPWDHAFDLLAVPDPVTGDLVLLMAHTHGLLRFSNIVN